MQINDKVKVYGTVEKIYKFPVLTNVCLHDQNNVKCWCCVKTNKNNFKIGDAITVKGIVQEFQEPNNNREFAYRFKLVK